MQYAVVLDTETRYYCGEQTSLVSTSGYRVKDARSQADSHKSEKRIDLIAPSLHALVLVLPDLLGQLCQARRLRECASATFPRMKSTAELNPTVDGLGVMSSDGCDPSTTASQPIIEVPGMLSHTEGEEPIAGSDGEELSPQ